MSASFFNSHTNSHTQPLIAVDHLPRSSYCSAGVLYQPAHLRTTRYHWRSGIIFIRLLSQLIGLALADTEKLGAADRANALGRRPLVLQSNCLRVLNLSLGPALHTICLHFYAPPQVLLTSRVANLRLFVNSQSLVFYKFLPSTRIL